MKILFHALAALALLCAPASAWAATLIAKDLPGLVAAVAAAQSGDTIRVAAGAIITAPPRLAAKPGLTFDMTDAVAVEWRMGLWQQVRFVGGTYRVTGSYRSALEIAGDGITFESPKVEGPGVVAGVVPDGYGLSFLGSATVPTRNVKVTGASFDGLVAGVRTANVVGLDVGFSGFTRIRGDGVSLSGVQDFRIVDNRFYGFLPDGLKHPDGIQANRPSATIAITRNGFIGRNYVEGPIQGIFVPDTQNVVIEGNHTHVIAATGIGVSGSTDNTLRDNLMTTWPGSTTISGVDTRLAVNLKFEGYNISRTYSGRAAIVYSGVDPATAPPPPSDLELATARAVSAETSLATSEAQRVALATQLAALQAQLVVANDNLAAANTNLTAALARSSAMQARIDAAKAALN